MSAEQGPRELEAVVDRLFAESDSAVHGLMDQQLRRVRETGMAPNASPIDDEAFSPPRPAVGNGNGHHSAAENGGAAAGSVQSGIEQQSAPPAAPKVLPVGTEAVDGADR